MKDLNSVLNFGNELPYLFIGSGFSRRYLGTPDWKGLLEYFCNMIHPDSPLAFNSIQEQARQKLKTQGKSADSLNEMNCAIADILEDEFNLEWYSNPLFEHSRKSSKDILSNKATPFKIEISNYFNDILSNPHTLTSELESLKKLSSNSIAGIITTNYDCLIEEYFDFTKYSTQEELLFSSTQELCEIYKIHGCSSNPATLIIDSEDYSDILKRRKYLAAKLLTIFVEHPIVFIGYSITDEDIRNILSDIVDCLNDSQLEQLRDRFIFIEYGRELSPSDYSIESMNYYINGKNIPMTKIVTNNYGQLYELLSQNKSKYPVKILRSLKQNIYELVASNDPCDKLKIMLPLHQLDSFKEAEFVIGVGIANATELGYSTFGIEEIYLDIVFDNKNFNADLLVEKTLLPHLSRTSGSMPLFKYLSQYSKSTLPEGYARYVDKITRADDLLNSSIINLRTTSYGCSIEEVKMNLEYPRSLYYIARLPIDNINPDSLHKYLIEIISNDPTQIKSGKDHPHSSDIRRLIKLYDWLVYYDKYKKIASMHSVPNQ